MTAEDREAHPPRQPAGQAGLGAQLRVLAFFFRRFLAHRRQLVLGLFCIPLANLADIAVTVTIGRAIDRLRGAEDTNFLLGVLGLVGLFGLCHAVFRFFQRWLVVVVSRRFECELKYDLFRQLTSLDFGFHNSTRSGDVVSRLTSDVENLRMFLGPGLMYTLGAIVVVPISLGLLFTIEPLLASIMILPMILMGMAMKLFSPRLHLHSTRVQESLADISHRAQENFSGIRVVKGYGREEEQAGRFAETSDENRENQIRLASARGLTHAAVHGANGLTFLVILLLAGFALIDGRMTEGQLFQFIDLTMKVFWPLIALGWIAGMFPRAVASGERVLELMGRSTPITDPERPVTLGEVRGELQLENVSFRYEGAARPALVGVDLLVPAGSTLGIVGPTGSGKTTLLHLFGRLFEAEGTIRLDGVPIQELGLEQLRGALGYVPQDSFLFSEPYRDNVALGVDDGPALEGLEDEAIWDWVDEACMREEVEAFPHGLDQLIGERGVTLSGGQRQRTCIARALARDPDVLVLDDCLSAVDTQTERHLLAGLGRAGSGRTVLVAAHRLSTVKEADQIVVLDEAGAVAQLGTHSELVEQDGWYRDTWRQQQRREEALSEL